VKTNGPLTLPPLLPTERKKATNSRPMLLKLRGAMNAGIQEQWLIFYPFRVQQLLIPFS